ncbi:hypothetical protein [Streptomyces cavernicola]|uniref:Uncharacterized protein n=1 Tax=Streptomyces cavernicola TaxID=3043613 RepID=A0ABT6SKY6_9ACTN|nr:hypothetical protein [Streptomyces sp. B-S-A6]MDI3408856.1 hypothetical protein [Streptomyces sp. B-S-A6]
MTTVAEPLNLSSVEPPPISVCRARQDASAETEASQAELTDAEQAWIAKWLERSPEWSAEKWNAMGQVLGVEFS